MGEDLDAQLARDLTAAYSKYRWAYAIVLKGLQQLMEATGELAAVIFSIQANVKQPFGRWCVKHCVGFDPRITRAICSVATRSVKGRFESWQLRLLGILRPIPHTERPLRQRAVRSVTWLSHLNRTTEELERMFERVGGVEKLSRAEREAVDQQLATFNNIQRRLRS